MELRPYYDVLRRTSLLHGMLDDELEQLLHCLSARTRFYQRGEILLMAGYPTTEIGILLKGRITALKSTGSGNSIAIAHMGPGGLFGDVLSGSGEKSPVTVMANEDCLALYLPYHKMLRPCAQLHACHMQLMQNLVETISGKYFALDRRIDILIRKSLRARVCLWLLEEESRQGSSTFTVSLTRAALAEYLNCDRSALSRELSHMQQEGLLETYRGSFKLLNREKIMSQAEA